MNAAIERGISRLEQIILSIAMICFGSLIVKSIFDGVGEYLALSALRALSAVGVAETTSRATVVDMTGAMTAYLVTIIWSAHWLVTTANVLFTGVYQFTKSIMTKLHDATFVSLIRNLYLNGPFIHGYGPGWAGRSPEDICGSMTNAKVSHWTKSDENIEECNRLIETNVQSYVLVLQLVLVIFLGFKYVNRAWEKCCRVRSRNSISRIDGGGDITNVGDLKLDDIGTETPEASKRKTELMKALRRRFFQ